MDKYEHRRLRLSELIQKEFGGRGGKSRFSEATGIDASYVSRMLYAEGKPGRKRIADDIIETMENALGLTRHWFDMPLGANVTRDQWANPPPDVKIMVSVPSPLGAPSIFASTGEHQKQSLSANAASEPERAAYNVEAAPRIGPITRVPVVGSAQLGDNGFRAELEYPVGHGDGYVAFAACDPDAYALRCIGDSMKPRIKAGEFVVIYPNLQPSAGDEVLVRFTDGQVMVKELLYIRDGILHLLSVNEAHWKITAPVSEVEKIHYVAAIVKKAMWSPE